jgi:hypothetical protein
MAEAIVLAESLGNDNVFLYTWKTFNDDKAVTLLFDPSASSSQSYMFVYARRDVGDWTFPPTVPDDCLSRIRQVLGTFPTTERGRMDEDYVYNIVGSRDELSNATKGDITELRLAVMQSLRDSREASDTLQDDTLRFQNRVNTGLKDIQVAVENFQMAMISTQQAAALHEESLKITAASHKESLKKTRTKLKELIVLQKASDAKFEELKKALAVITKKLGRLYFSLFMFVTNVCVP